MLDISNYYEQLVTDRLWEIVEDQAQPLSQVFIEDVACLALNNLPACYVRSRVDKGASVTEQQYQTMREAVDKAIIDAIDQVRDRPHDYREA